MLLFLKSVEEIEIYIRHVAPEGSDCSSASAQEGVQRVARTWIDVDANEAAAGEEEGETGDGEGRNGERADSDRSGGRGGGRGKVSLEALREMRCRSTQPPQQGQGQQAQRQQQGQSCTYELRLRHERAVASAGGGGGGGDGWEAEGVEEGEESWLLHWSDGHTAADHQQASTTAGAAAAGPGSGRAIARCEHNAHTFNSACDEL